MMKNIYNYIAVVTIVLIVSCSKSENKSVESIIKRNDLTELRSKKAEIVLEQHKIKEQIKLLDDAISKLDVVKKLPIVTTLKIHDTLFNHYIELQGNVSTKDLLVIYPEFSGILTKVYVKEGQNVKKGQLLAKIEDGGLSQQLDQLQIRKELAKTTYERQKRLWNQKIGSELQFLQAKSNYEAQVKAINQLKKQIAKTNIMAPFSGTIDDVITEQGNVVFPGQTPIIRIINLNNMYVETKIPEKYISDVSKNNHVIVEFPILGTTLHTKIRQVGNYINPANRTFKAEISIPNKEKFIKPNLTAKLKINDYTNKNALLIPQSIISENANGEQYIYIVKNKNNQNEAKAEKVMIKTGKTQGDVIEVINGINSGDEIIKEGARSVSNGQTVKIINS